MPVSGGSIGRSAHIARLRRLTRISLLRLSILLCPALCHPYDDKHQCKRQNSEKDFDDCVNSLSSNLTF